jgi:hypothetical protein
MLGVDELRDLVGRGDIDTVVAVFPDLYGRLVGKRNTGDFFCDHVLESGMHACDFLLACDMEMDPVPGYRFTSWAKGYGDVTAARISRRCGARRGSTARWCSATSTTKRQGAGRRRAALDPGKTARAGRGAGFAKGGSSSSFRAP